MRLILALTASLLTLILLTMALALSMPVMPAGASDALPDFLNWQVEEVYQQDTETRLLVAYHGSQGAASADDFTLNTWSYVVLPVMSPDGHLLGYQCQRRADNILPSVEYLRAYQALGGLVYEDGSCNQVVTLP